MRAICLHGRGLSLVRVDRTFYPDGTRIGALTFPDNIAALSHSWDFISQPNAGDACAAPSPRRAAFVTAFITRAVCRARLRASVLEHNLPSLNMCSFEFLPLSLQYSPVLSACLLVVWGVMTHYSP